MKKVRITVLVVANFAAIAYAIYSISKTATEQNEQVEIGGTEASAREFLEQEVNKWIAGQKSGAATLQAAMKNLKPPVSYNIRSVVDDEADIVELSRLEKPSSNWREWPAFRISVAFEFVSVADTPVTNLATYTLTWHAERKRWCMSQRFN